VGRISVIRGAIIRVNFHGTTNRRLCLDRRGRDSIRQHALPRSWGQQWPIKSDSYTSAEIKFESKGQHSDVPSEGCRHPVHGHCLTSLRSVIVSKCQNLPASTAQTAVPSTSLFAARQTRRQTPRSYAADAVPRSKEATAGSSSNTSSWIVQGPKPKHRIVDERLGYVLLGP
jgi:hypothetical protein